jgi:hypothetical protein
MNEKHDGQASVPIFDGVFVEEDWSYVNHTQIVDSSKFFDSDTNIITGFNFRLDALLNGGIIFKRAGKKMQSEAKDWFSQKFSKFMRDVVRSRWCYGFAACAWLPHAQYGGIPVVLDLTQLQTRMKHNIFGETQYRYFWQPTNGAVAIMEVKDVITFTWDSPDADGNLRSMVPMLVPDYMHELMLMNYSLIAAKSCATPPMIVEQEKDQYDKDNIRVPSARTPRELGLTKGRDGPTGDASMSIDSINHTKDYMDRVQPSITDAVLTNIGAVAQVPYFSGMFRLEQGRHYVAPTLPQGPQQLLEFRVARQERAFSLMGVPLAMVSNNTSTGGNKLASSQNPNSFVVFDNSQQALKLELINVMKSLFYSIHLQAHLDEYLQHTPAKEWNMDGARKASEVTIELPSVSLTDPFDPRTM